MKKKIQNAIKVLDQYKVDLKNVSDTKSGNNWKAKVLDALARYIGTDAALYKRMNDEVFTDRVAMTNAIGLSHNYNPNRKSNFEGLIDDLKAHIQHHGLKEDYLKKNFLSMFSSKELLTVGIPAIVALLGFFYAWGRNEGVNSKDQELLTRDRDINIAKDTIARLKEERTQLIKDLSFIESDKIRDSEYLNYCDSMFLVYSKSKEEIKKGAKVVTINR